MKTLFCLTVLCASLAVCHGACYLMNNDAQIKEGELVRGCVDHFDKSEHPIGATWNSHQCLSCTCEETTISCCTSVYHVSPFALSASLPGTTRGP
ncbi:small serum protein 5-like isoform 2-T2 [Macrochelys suwanniensis]